MNLYILKEALRTYTSNPRPLSEKKISTLLSVFHKCEFEKETILINQGDHWGKVYFIEKGIVRLFILTPDGREYNKNFFAEGMFIWPATPGTRLHPSLFSIGTLEKSEIWIADFSEFQKHLVNFKRWLEFALFFTELLADQKFVREYELLMCDAEARYKSLLQKHPHLVGRVPDYHLASYLGITNVTFSRIKKKTIFNIC